ncbi:MAG: vWA domain-containing protein [Kineosporiaceae bacterium]
MLAAYLVLDTSDSMAGPALAALNTELGRLFDALRDDSRLADACRLSVLTFDADARVHIALTPVVDLGRSPLLTATRPATNYEAAFLLVRRQIERDLDGLRVAGHDPMRPLVFFLTDGRPTRGFWPPAHLALADPSWRDAPDVVALGFGNAVAHVVRSIGTAGAYLPASAPGVPSAAPAGMLAAVMSFILGAVEGGQVETVVAPAATGWRSLDEVERRPRRSATSRPTVD